MRFRVNMMTVGVSQGLGFSKFSGSCLVILWSPTEDMAGH